MCRYLGEFLSIVRHDGFLRSKKTIRCILKLFGSGGGFIDTLGERLLTVKLEAQEGIKTLGKIIISNKNGKIRVEVVFISGRLQF